MLLNDIFPSIEIVEYSLYYFILLCVLFMGTIYFLVRFYLKHQKRTRGYYISLLEKSIEDDAKHLAYKLGYYGKRVVRTPVQEAKLQHLLEVLEPFKYQEVSLPLDTSLQKQFEDFLHALRHQNV
jgi:hypothetical protein